MDQSAGGAAGSDAGSAVLSQLKPLVEASLGARLSECFREVDEEPVGHSLYGAGASRAVTLSGEEVVLKIRKPGIEEKIEADLRLMRKIAEIAEAQSQEMRRYHPCRNHAGV
jgi:ubiquinone biosynthesis protein